MNLHVNTVFAGRYRLIKKIGLGGFSEVWQVADQMAEDKIMVLKVYAPEKGLDEHGIKLFRREFAITLDLHHQGLLKSNYFDVSEGSPYLIMPYCSGGSLYGRLMEYGVMNERELATMLVEVADALAYLHKNDILHQDIKPDNILINAHGNYLLTDFGISSRLRNTLQKSTTTTAMTIAYAPPEKANGVAVVDQASDIFSLGIMMFEMLTNILPWDGSGGYYIRSDTHLPDLPDTFSAELSKLIKACLRFDGKQRPTAYEIAQSARHYLAVGMWNVRFIKGNRNTEQKSIAATSTEKPFAKESATPKPPAAPAYQKKNGKPMVLALLALVLVAGGVIYYISYSSQEKNNHLQTIGTEEQLQNGGDFADTNSTSLDSTVQKFNSDQPILSSDSIDQPPQNSVKPLKVDLEKAFVFDEGDIWFNGWGYFSEGLAVVKKDGKYGFVDTNGYLITEIIYEMVSSFNDGMAMVHKNGKTGYIDVKGQIVIPFREEFGNGFSEGLAAIYKKGGEVGYVDKRGKIVIPYIAGTRFGEKFSEGLVIVEKNGKKGFIDMNGRLVIPFIYDIAHNFSEGLASVQLNKKYGCIDKQGETVIPFAYEYISEFSEGLAMFKENDKYGYLDTRGEIVIPAIYDRPGQFSEGLASVASIAINGHLSILSFIDKNGKIVIPFKYGSVDKFSEGLAPVSIHPNGERGYMNKAGKLVIPYTYAGALPFSEGFAYVQLEYGGKWGFIDKKGKPLIIKQ